MGVQTTIFCPYCGESNTITLDQAAGEAQDYIEDCQVCCQPWQVTVRWDDGEPQVDVRRGGE